MMQGGRRRENRSRRVSKRWSAGFQPAGTRASCPRDWCARRQDAAEPAAWKAALLSALRLQRLQSPGERRIARGAARLPGARLGGAAALSLLLIGTEDRRLLVRLGVVESDVAAGGDAE